MIYFAYYAASMPKRAVGCFRADCGVYLVHRHAAVKDANYDFIPSEQFELNFIISCLSKVYIFLLSCETNPLSYT